MSDRREKASKFSGFLTVVWIIHLTWNRLVGLKRKAHSLQIERFCFKVIETNCSYMYWAKNSSDGRLRQWGEGVTWWRKGPHRMKDNWFIFISLFCFIHRFLQNKGYIKMNKSCLNKFRHIISFIIMNSSLYSQVTGKAPQTSGQKSKVFIAMEMERWSKVILKLKKGYVRERSFSSGEVWLLSHWGPQHLRISNWPIIYAPGKSLIQCQPCERQMSY